MELMNTQNLGYAWKMFVIGVWGFAGASLIATGATVAGVVAKATEVEFDAAAFDVPTKRWLGQLDADTFLVINVFKSADGVVTGYGEIANGITNINALLAVPAGKSTDSKNFEIKTLIVNAESFLMISGKGARYEGEWNSYEKAWSGALYQGDTELLLALRSVK